MPTAAKKPPLIPFRAAARQHFTQVGVIAYTAGTKAPTINLPKVGYLATLVIRIFGTMTGDGTAPTYVNTVEQAFNLISRFRVNGNGGNLNVCDLTGFDLYCLSHLGWERGFKLDAGGTGSSSVDPTLFKTPLASGATTDFAITYAIPVNANQGLNFDTGLILLQAQDAVYTLDMDFAPLASIYATHAPTPSNMTVEVGYLWYEFPDPNRVALPPPLICRLQAQDYQPVIAGENHLVVPRAGTLMQAIIINKIDGGYSSTVVDEVSLKLNLNATAYNMKGYQNRWWNRMRLNVDFPAGVNAYDFYHSTQSVSEGDTRDMWDLTQYSTFELLSKITTVASPSTSNIRCIYRTLQQLQA